MADLNASMLVLRRLASICNINVPLQNDAASALGLPALFGERIGTRTALRGHFGYAIATMDRREEPGEEGEKGAPEHRFRQATPTAAIAKLSPQQGDSERNSHSHNGKNTGAVKDAPRHHAEYILSRPDLGFWITLLMMSAQGMA
ncbi:MAG: hypothetical protein MI924_01360 [Chloroflexales bacterium]|nr:hypothetical protein [Chloroflexales bacterium]